MSDAVARSLGTTIEVKASAERGKKSSLVAALVTLTAIIIMPAVKNLRAAGQVMLGILAFAVNVWITEALDYAAGGGVIGALMIFLLAFVPDGAKPAHPDTGTVNALILALSGVSSTAVARVSAACFIEAAMTATGLDRRIALVVLSKVDAKTNHSVIGPMIVGFLLPFIVPSTTARVACLMPFAMRCILAFKVNAAAALPDCWSSLRRKTASTWNVGIKTAGSRNMVEVGFIEQQFQTTISRTEWSIAGAPFAALFSVALYFIMTRMMKSEMAEIVGGKATNS